jgi:hypothetical protein
MSPVPAFRVSNYVGRAAFGEAVWNLICPVPVILS